MIEDKMQSPSNRSITSEESEADTPTSSKSSDSQNIASSPSRSPSPKKNTSKSTAKNENTNDINKKINNKNIIKSNPPPPTTEQTPTRFLAACSKLDLEPNPFEQSFSGVAPHNEGAGQSTPKPMLPPVAQLTSPSPGNDYWNLTHSLRSGPLSPSMLEAPQEPMIFNSTLLTNGRTGTTPLPFSTFTEQSSSTRSTALFGAANGNSFIGSPVSSLNLSAFPSQGVLMDSDRKNVATSKTITKPLINSVSNIPTTADNNNISSTQSTDLSNGSTNVVITNQIGHQTDITIIPKSEKDTYNDLSNTNNPIAILQNNNNSNIISDDDDDDDISTTLQKNIIVNHQSSFDQEPSSPQDKINSHNHNKSVPRRRKTDDFPMSEQSPTKKSNQKTKNELTDEEKRRNFLERNRQAALKCRQRKKQWLANLQAKVEFLTNDNENLQNQAQSLREEIFNLKTLLLAHKDCPITQANGGLTLDTITSGIGGIQQPINGVPINIGVGMVPNPMQTPQNQGVQPNGVHVQIPQNMSNHGPPGSGMLRY